MNKDILIKTSIGAAIGFASAFVVDVVVKHFSKKEDENVVKVRLEPQDYIVDPPEEEEEPIENDITEVRSRLQGYISHSKYEQQLAENESPSEDDDAPTVLISMSDFMSLNGYDKQTLTLYEGDGTLANDDYADRIEDIDKVVGRYAFSHFGEYEDDSVFVRDVEQKIDYQIVRTIESYTHSVLGINDENF